MLTAKERKKMLYNMASKICSLYEDYTASATFVDNNLVNTSVRKKFLAFKEAIVKQYNDIKL